MTCTTCRPPQDKPTFQGEARLWLYRLRAGYSPVICPECGETRNPWEFPPPVWVATGLRWKAERFASAPQRVSSWQIMQSGVFVGLVWWSSLTNEWLAARFGHVGVLHTGTLAGCCRALVAEVRRG